MSDVWIGISPGPLETRVLAMAARETILKARLPSRPSHLRALPTLLEAIALWEGTKVRAALCAADKDGLSDSSLYRDAILDFGGPLYDVEWVPSSHGEFGDLRRLLLAR